MSDGREERVRLANIAAAEVGIAQGFVLAADGGMEYHGGDDNSNPLVVRAAYLATARAMGPDYPTVCPLHSWQSRAWMCPTYPVGELLQGATCE